MMFHDPQLASRARPSVSDSLGAKNTYAATSQPLTVHPLCSGWQDISEDNAADILVFVSLYICTVKPANVPNKSCLEVCEAGAHVALLICLEGRPQGASALRFGSGAKTAQRK